MSIDVATLARLFEEQPAPLLPHWTDTSAWGRFRDAPLGREALAAAEAALGEPAPVLTASGYLAFRRTGERRAYEAGVNRRRERVLLFLLGLCLSGPDRFAEPLMDQLWSILEESSWVVPAHSTRFVPDGLHDHAQVPLIDLWSATTSQFLAEVDAVAADALPASLRARLRSEIARRTLRPFLDKPDHRWDGTGGPREAAPNWTAVCAGGAGSAALLLEADPQRLATLVHRAMQHMAGYLATFGRDGGSAEGVGYWEFGFGHFAMFADLLHRRSVGRVDLFADAHVRRIAAFPLALALTPRRYAAFSDMQPERRPAAPLLRFLARRMELPALAGLEPGDGLQDPFASRRRESERLRAFLWQESVPDVPLHLPPSHWLPDLETLVAREGALSLAVKAGHNGEPHNHNDVGSVVIAVADAVLVAELGAGHYDRAYFDAASRYKQWTTRSGGHSVPLVDGYEQATGRDATARDVSRNEGPNSDALSMDLAVCYPQAGLIALRRTVTLDRSSPAAITLSDAARWASCGDHRLECALITTESTVTPCPGGVVIGADGQALRVTCADPAVRLEIDVLKDLKLKSQRMIDAKRLRFVCQTAGTDASILVRFELDRTTHS